MSVRCGGSMEPKGHSKTTHSLFLKVKEYLLTLGGLSVSWLYLPLTGTPVLSEQSRCNRLVDVCLPLSQSANCLLATVAHTSLTNSRQVWNT